jgi:hypothetical protein
MHKHCGVTCVGSRLVSNSSLIVDRYYNDATPRSIALAEQALKKETEGAQPTGDRFKERGNMWPARTRASSVARCPLLSSPGRRPVRPEA